MAQNRRPEAEARDGSSSEEDGEGSSEEIEEHEESESESEEEEKDKAPAPSIKKSLPFTLKKPETTQASTHRKISSSNESGSESASESDSPNPNVKPLASKPMEEPLKATKKPRSKLSSVTPVAKPTKRQLESENNKNRESKRAKKKPEDADRGVAEDTAKKTGDDSKKQLFQRLWSEDDEIAILKGMIEYKAKKGSDPITDMNAFHDFIKKSLHVDVSKVQLSDKVRRLRKKYENNFKKAKKGKDRTFSKSHEQEAYEWSKKIWGGDADGGVVESTKLDGKANKSRTQKPTPKEDGPASADRANEGTKMAVEPNSVAPRPVQSGSSIGKLGLDDDIVKDGLELISESKRVELEEKWRKFRMQEVELYLRRLDLIQEQTKLVLEALKSSGN